MQLVIYLSHHLNHLTYFDLAHKVPFCVMIGSLFRSHVVCDFSKISSILIFRPYLDRGGDWGCPLAAPSLILEASLLLRSFACLDRKKPPATRSCAYQ